MGSRIEEELEDHESDHREPHGSVEQLRQQQHPEPRGAEEEAPRLGPHVAPAADRKQPEDETGQNEEVDPRGQLDRADDAVERPLVRRTRHERHEQHRKEDPHAVDAHPLAGPRHAAEDRLAGVAAPELSPWIL